VSEESRTLWMSADIARKLGISPSLVANWSNYKTPYTPTPFATTPGGTRLWSYEQVTGIIADHHQRVAVMKARSARAEERKAEKQRSERMIRVLNGGTK
jgi:hypothetical protein